VLVTADKEEEVVVAAAEGANREAERPDKVGRVETRPCSAEVAATVEAGGRRVLQDTGGSGSGSGGCCLRQE